MGHQVTIGGNRLGSGKKMMASLHNYERSTHDLGYIWRSTMASGTLVPFLKEVALPGDTFDIDLNCNILTHPTIGPLFGTYKIQLDVFQIPIRLYQGKLHMNMLGIGMDMSNVALPQLRIDGPVIDTALPIDNQQINPSCILSYLGMRGLGIPTLGLPQSTITRRDFNAVPYLAYWDIYKNYYANKQEEVGVVIHKDTVPYIPVFTGGAFHNVYVSTLLGVGTWGIPVTKPADPVPTTRIRPFAFSDLMLYVTPPINGQLFDTDAIMIWIKGEAAPTAIYRPIPLTQLFEVIEVQPNLGRVIATAPITENWPDDGGAYVGWTTYNSAAADTYDSEPRLTSFALENIDNMRRLILAHLADTPFIINSTSHTPYSLPLKTELQQDGITRGWSQKFPQEGLAIKTYQSDLFNNWISTEWIDGPDGISEITKIDTSGGSFTIDELNMSRKVYDMLNRIAISGGSYDDWLDAVYTHERNRSAENPMYIGGMIKNLVFQEVVSNAATAEAPLGTLAGRGTLGKKDKGGHITAKIDEPSYIMGIISLTPNVDYSQGNHWDTNLATLNDFHKPALDEIGFQDLITDQMAWWDTEVDAAGIKKYKSAGKQPAWINYMTNVNKVYGNFAEQAQQMFMVLNRRYDAQYTGFVGTSNIRDLTTYIDPVKFNHIFADTRRDAQNFWAQVGVDMTVRRKMSAKIMPNL